jgi:hypothetical protein
MAGTGKGPLRVAIEDFLRTAKLSDVIFGGLKTQIEKLEQEGYSYLLTLYEKLGISKDVPSFLKPVPGGGVVKEAQFDLVTIIGLIIGFIVAAAGAVAHPLTRLEEYKIEHLWETARPDPSTAFRMLFRNPASQDKMHAALHDQGWSAEYQQLFYQAIVQRPNVNELLTLWRRGRMTADELYTALQQEGVDVNSIGRYQDLTEQLPGISDLVHFADRFAWDEGIAARFQYDSEYPPDVETEAAKIGIKPETFKRYWRSHWQLPGLSDVMDMYHRLRPGRVGRPFTEDDLNNYLKTTPLPPYFHELVKEIAYNPYTRVDIRRLYGEGVVDEAEVLQTYLDLGYDQTHAEKLTAYTIKGSKAEEKGLTKDAVTSLYQDGLISRVDAGGMLTDLGFSAEATEFWLLMVDHTLDQTEINAKLSDIQTRFISGELNDSTVMSELGSLNLPSDRVTRILHLWDVQREAHVKKPSSAVLTTWYKGGLIAGQDLLDGLKRDGYNAKDAALFVQQIDKDVAAAAAKDAAAADAEAVRLQSQQATKAAQYQRAVLDANIAQIKLNVADAKLALYGTLTADETTQVTDILKNAPDQIAELQLQKATVKVNLLKPASS